MANITRHAPAKVNLFLHITGKRPDDYHLLESLVVFTEYGDEIQVIEDNKLSLEIIGEFASALSNLSKEDNLIWKAAIALQSYLLESRDSKSKNSKYHGARIILSKNLPIASGIGGGSADAAATIHALCELWNIDINDKKLSKIIFSLGSDVPVCLYGKTALMRGVGDEITEVTLQEKPYIVLINPNIPLATAEIFKEFRKKPFSPSKQNFILSQFSCTEIINEAGYANDLEEIAIKKLPVISKIIESLRITKGCFLTRMSGSGATCFALYHNKIEADNAAKKLKEIYQQAWCISTRIR